MFKPLATILSVAMLSIGATAASAQRHGGTQVKPARVGGRGDNRDGRVRENPRRQYTERVWVEDFEMVEERYQEAGHFEHRDRKVWIEETHVTVIERVFVPESRIIVTERVLVPESKYFVEVKVHVEGKIVEYQETMEFSTGHSFTFTRLKYVPAHDECRKVEKCRPAHYEDQQVEKCVPAHHEDREVIKCVPGHFETICEQVFVEGCFKARMVRKSTGGHFEVRPRR